MEMIKLEVNGVAVEVPKGSNLLVAAQAANVKHIQEEYLNRLLKCRQQQGYL